jgi:hypothetical protein
MLTLSLEEKISQLLNLSRPDNYLISMKERWEKAYVSLNPLPHPGEGTKPPPFYWGWDRHLGNWPLHVTEEESPQLSHPVLALWPWVSLYLSEPVSPWPTGMILAISQSIRQHHPPPPTNNQKGQQELTVKLCTPDIPSLPGKPLLSLLLFLQGMFWWSNELFQPEARLRAFTHNFPSKNQATAMVAPTRCSCVEPAWPLHPRAPKCAPERELPRSACRSSIYLEHQQFGENKHWL